MDSFLRSGLEDHERVKDYLIKDSEHIGKTYYVCDFRHAVGQSRAFRDLKPTHVILISKEDYKNGFEALSPKNKNLSKRICFSENVFIEMLKSNGEINYKKHVPIYDNTGSNALDSCALFIFESKKEAEIKYNELIDLFISDLEEKKKVVLSEIENQIYFCNNKKIT